MNILVCGILLVSNHTSFSQTSSRFIMKKVIERICDICDSCKRHLGDDEFATYTTNEKGEGIAICDSCRGIGETCGECGDPLSFDESWDDVDPICAECKCSSEVVGEENN